ncbi:MAG: hypothetical protein GY850_03120 [bacterium]|nr:hypothetical protein [bacterium]
MALLLWGCDTTAAVPAKPKVVRKKIVAPKGNTAKVSTKKTVRTVNKKPAGKSRTQTVVAKVDQTQADAKNQQAAKKNTDSRLPIANVVRKKIVAPKGNTVKVSTKKTVGIVDKKPAGKSRTQAVVAKVDQTQPDLKNQPGAKKNIDSRILIASNEKSKPMQSLQLGQVPVAKPLQSNQPSLVKQKKPAINPKSEITEIKQAAKKQAQPAGSKTLAAVKMNSTEPTAANAPKVLVAGHMPPQYDPKGKIDPFEPLVREMPASVRKKKNIKRQPRTPLERVALSQLKLTAIILASSGNRAMVEETSGKGYVVKKGTYIGINGGKISNINKEIVFVEERFEDFSGKIQTRKRELKLPKPPGEF